MTKQEILDILKDSLDEVERNSEKMGYAFSYGCLLGTIKGLIDMEEEKWIHL